MTCKAVVLLSGGLDSATSLAIALSDGFECHALSIVYGQRHHCETAAATKVARAQGATLQVVSVPALGEVADSALTNDDIDVPKNRADAEIATGVPATYVPARNTVLLGLALSLAESIGSRTIYTGFNVLDASGYPDCRPEFVRAFEALANVATRPGEPWMIRAPLIALTKAQIIRRGVELGVDYGLTHSCYDPVEASTSFGRPVHLACRECDSCVLRRKGFVEAGVTDPTQYA